VRNRLDIGVVFALGSSDNPVLREWARPALRTTMEP